VPAIRQRVRFALHDLGRAPPPGGNGGFHLVACRNVLIYWTRDVQRRILQAVTEATIPEGFLVLGESEWPLDEAALLLRDSPHGDRIFERLAQAAAPA
jgi:chemotaxis methyl-accepting protein methylase